MNIKINTIINEETIKKAVKVLQDNGIEEWEDACVVLQAIGYVLLDTELFPED